MDSLEQRRQTAEGRSTPKAALSPARNLEKIHRRKRATVRDCVGIATRNKEIRRMIVFGSSVTDQCGENSDLDICLDICLDIAGGAKKRSVFESVADMSVLCGGACDILIYSHLSEPLKGTIERKGVVVYELP